MAEWTRYSVMDPENERYSMDDNTSKPKHVSLQPLIDNIAAESMTDYTRRHSLARSKRSSITYVASASRNRSMVHETMPPAALKTDMAGFSNTEGFWDTQSLCSPIEDQPIIPPGQQPPMKLSVAHEALFIGMVIAAQFMALCGFGQGIPPMHIIAKALGAAGPGEEAWFTSAYGLTSGTFILISGRIGDIIGHKRMLVFGYFFLGVWSGFAGFSVYLGGQVFFDVWWPWTF
ncbi:hypothetical protein EJ03DRAFT_154437 [Teratosphaeria nubilosa]|uniref:Major facilitator superfamily (MFS) profile domain-containing protein n=1 Tax=Teratosphaeria nubilosa TaxID=161662 RepID=A0A6G1LL23_9PEZI|nr:hypothetical protein EJ03DRAFT_154437 [Teratosphaeria nubilosa]